MVLPRVEVVLSTYAARQDWLEQQLDSVWEQTGVDVSLLVRDDGSPDDTADRVQALLRGRPGRLVRGDNVGPGLSFLAALREADAAAPHVAFCDQDDVWVPDKLRRAVATLAAMPSPAMYSARVALVDEQLRPLGLHQLHHRGHSFANALVQCAATGCTIVLDRPAVTLVSAAHPRDVVMHDAWVYLVLAGCGTSVYDAEPVVHYRQHVDNVVGVAATPFGRWSGRLRRQLATGHRRVHTRQDHELARLHTDDLTAEARSLLARHLRAADGRWPRRLWWALTGPPHRQDRPSDVAYRVLFVLGRV